MSLEYVRHSCHYDFKVLWSYRLGHSPVVSPPVIFDIDANGIKDVIATSYADQFTILQGNSGKHLEGVWPLHMKEVTMYSSPLLYDIDHDLEMDSLLSTYDGEIIFFRNNGTKLKNKKIKIPKHKISYRKQQSNTEDNITINTNQEKSSKEKFLKVDPHILATPAIADINGDGVEEEIVIIVNWYFDNGNVKHHLNSRSNITSGDVRDGIHCGAVVFNLTNGKLIKKIVLESSKMTSLYKPYAVATPTLLNLQPQTKSDLDILVGTLSGNLYIVNLHSKDYPEPVTIVDNIQGQITVADLTDNEGLEIIVTDSSANVNCLSSKGEVIWDSMISGTFIAGSRTADVNNDANLDVITASNDGYVWALDGKSGKTLKHWPINLHHRLHSVVLMTYFRNNSLHLVISSIDGYLFIIDLKSRCLEVLRFGTHAVGATVQILADDIVPEVPGLELILATLDGNIICLGEKENGHKLQTPSNDLNSWPSETLSYNGFTPRMQNIGVIIKECPHEVNQMQFAIKFEIYDNSMSRRMSNNNPPYHVKIYIGSNHVLLNTSYQNAGLFEENLNSLTYPKRTLLTIRLTNYHSETITDSIAIRLKP
ncbi:uncharacterized protein TRIADDRAFT_57158 [Trichoplax adhaerens]|uniref:DEX1 C-terminal domain-containing protein n=1 Tax=Trichoplax adhaerens TaxID=10228 RepID=B3S0T0_TRIAD|nr:hypothetical protein TRIADDRAFT_57158 [Trichoplax adhaerens]EDV23697.1 hypothetical protein TRIADDRAFT_57158 [Trichoplax adhaerens]|eukprot:XP_002113223.1 hypothetical protein TRIADDRAFT_57158 [Trichoplax adhaerens]